MRHGKECYRVWIEEYLGIFNNTEKHMLFQGDPRIHGNMGSSVSMWYASVWIENDMSISAAFRLLKGQLSVFRLAAHIEIITQYTEVDLVCMVSVWSSVHTPCIQRLIQRPWVWSLTQTAKQKNIFSQFGMHSTLLNMQKKILAYLQNVCFFMVFPLAKILATDFNKGNTSILNLLFSVSSNNSITESVTSLDCKGPLKIIYAPAVNTDIFN